MDRIKISLDNNLLFAYFQIYNIIKIVNDRTSKIQVIFKTQNQENFFLKNYIIIFSSACSYSEVEKIKYAFFSFLDRYNINFFSDNGFFSEIYLLVYLPKNFFFKNIEKRYYKAALNVNKFICSSKKVRLSKKKFKFKKIYKEFIIVYIDKKYKIHILKNRYFFKKNYKQIRYIFLFLGK